MRTETNRVQQPENMDETPQSDAPPLIYEHSMDVEPRSDGDPYVGRPLEEVPKRDPGEDCNGRRWERRDEDNETVFVGYCKNRAGKGTDHVGEGRCKFHGGAADNTGESNGNYVHGGYSQLWGDDPSRDPSEIVDELAAKHTESKEEIARLIAAELLVQMHRTDDPRFLGRWRRYFFECIHSDPFDSVQDRG